MYCLTIAHFLSTLRSGSGPRVSPTPKPQEQDGEQAGEHRSEEDAHGTPAGGPGPGTGSWLLKEEVKGDEAQADGQVKRGGRVSGRSKTTVGSRKEKRNENESRRSAGRDTWPSSEGPAHMQNIHHSAVFLQTLHF